MKTILTYIVALITISITSCDVVEIDQLNATDSNDGLLAQKGLQGPVNVPSSEVEILNLLHDGSNKLWESEGFILFGMSGFLSCRLDDKMTLSADGLYTYDGGSSLCGAEDNARVKEGTWKLATDLLSIVFTEGSNSYKAELVGLTNDQITLRGDYRGLEVNAVYASN